MGVFYSDDCLFFLFRVYETDGFLFRMYTQIDQCSPKMAKLKAVFPFLDELHIKCWESLSLSRYLCYVTLWPLLHSRFCGKICRFVMKKTFDGNERSESLAMYKCMAIFPATIRGISNKILIESQVNSFHVLEHVLKWSIWFALKRKKHRTLCLCVGGFFLYRRHQKKFCELNFRENCQKREKNKLIDDQ